MTVVDLFEGVTFKLRFEVREAARDVNVSERASWTEGRPPVEGVRRKKTCCALVNGLRGPGKWDGSSEAGTSRSQSAKGHNEEWGSKGMGVVGSP